MKAVIQRVSRSSVTIEGEKVAEINSGLMVLLGIINEDTQEDIIWLSRKIANLRIFGNITLLADPPAGNVKRQTHHTTAQLQHYHQIV